MRFFKAAGFFILVCLTTTSAMAKKNSYEQKGRFGLVIGDNFMTLNYVITYLNESHKADHLAFQLDLEDSKGLDLAHEVVESECKLKNSKKQTVTGKVERRSVNSIILLFPLDENFEKTRKMTVYTVIRDYKLKKTFKL